MSEPGMEAVLASLMAEHVSDDEATTGEGDPLGAMTDTCTHRWITLHDGAKRCGRCGVYDWQLPDEHHIDDPTTDWFLTGSHYPTRPCKRCGSREHDDCLIVAAADVRVGDMIVYIGRTDGVTATADCVDIAAGGETWTLGREEPVWIEREHNDCVDWCTCGTCWECTR